VSARHSITAVQTAVCNVKEKKERKGKGQANKRIGKEKGERMEEEQDAK
jgi:hypothetical protein